MLSQALARLGRGAARRPWVVIGAWLILTVTIVSASNLFGAKLEDSFDVPGLDSQRANDLLKAAGSDSSGLTAQVVLSPRDPDATFFDSATARAALAETQARAEALPNVLSTSDPDGALTAGAEVAVQRGVISSDGRVARLRLQYPTIERTSAADLQNLKDFGAAARAGSPLQVELGGDLFFAYEGSDGGVGELVGLLAAAAILFLAFGSMAATFLPIGMAIFGLAVGVSSMSLLAHLIEIPSYAPVLGAMVGLGVGIDYALFVVTRHRDYLACGMAVEESVGRALATAGRPVVFAGGIVVVSILGLAVAGVPFMTAGGVAIATVVLIMVAASVTLLPASLGLAGQRINSRRSRRTTRAEATSSLTDSPVPDGGWQRWVRHVSRNPARYAIGVSALLLALASPVLALRVGIPDDGALPPDRTERRAYDLIADGFGAGFNGPVVIAVDLAADNEAVGPLAAAVLADPGIAAVSEPVISAEADVAVLIATPTTGPQEQATKETVERLRATVFPTVLDGRRARAHVGGQTANFADVGQRVQQRLPVFIAAVLAMSFVLLMLVFRSVLVPLKAVLLNLLSIAASYGVMVMVFQWGWGAGLIGVQETVPIVSFIPMFMFAILFGLSMDYEVFLLARVREEHQRTGDTHEAVVSGIARTGKVITSAAAIMISVFLAFVFGPDAATKMFGIGLATAILVDATLVRLVLVPATMTLLGKANWWLPSWLDRILPHLEVEASSPRPPTRHSHQPELGRVA